MVCLMLLQYNMSHGKNIKPINMLRLSGIALRRHMVLLGRATHKEYSKKRTTGSIFGQQNYTQLHQIVRNERLMDTSKWNAQRIRKMLQKAPTGCIGVRIAASVLLRNCCFGTRTSQKNMIKTIYDCISAIMLWLHACCFLIVYCCGDAVVECVTHRELWLCGRCLFFLGRATHGRR